MAASSAVAQWTIGESGSTRAVERSSCRAAANALRVGDLHAKRIVRCDGQVDRQMRGLVGCQQQREHPLATVHDVEQHGGVLVLAGLGRLHLVPGHADRDAGTRVCGRWGLAHQPCLGLVGRLILVAVSTEAPPSKKVPLPETNAQVMVVSVPSVFIVTVPV